MPEDERQPPAAHLSGPAWLELLAAGELEVEGRLPWSSNYSFLATVRFEESEQRAVYKPGRGERPLWDYPGGLYRREVAAYELSAALALDIVPETVLRVDGPHGEGSVQRFIDADFAEHYFTLLNEDRHRAPLRRIAAFDLLANNGDRKGGHLLVDWEDRIWGIDHGLCFHVEGKLRTVMWDFAGEELPAEMVSGCELVADAIPERVAAVLGPDECEALRRRAVALLRKPCFPSPRDDYRAYPWPLV
ncbi:MAG TPA: SCO1664 family protein [Acidimicrobiales bacterium]|nr:SCO1664 family protein [Acidimicrobiales bacterium]